MDDDVAVLEQALQAAWDELEDAHLQLHTVLRRRDLHGDRLLTTAEDAAAQYLERLRYIQKVRAKSRKEGQDGETDRPAG